ncbi:hypothetical protein V6N13_047658 [Hibiscus sabdariffa]|uniref:Pectinesterase n=1 Tax=Hibiscus sabdariffa TaxID=183260 RepID=A0ABR2F4T6_9ROSI
MFTAVMGPKFLAKNIGFQNTAGAIKHQAVALKIQSDQTIFHNRQMDGYQDTLYAHSQRQFFRDCTISGTIDFIFGDSTAVFQNCKLIIRKPLDKQQCIVTAQGRSNRRLATGFVLQNCIISGAQDYLPVKASSKTYLGRPWHEYSRTLFMQSQLDDIIAPEGWMPWNGNFALDTHSQRQFFRDCTISGTIDFIFGDSTAVFQNCKLIIRKPLDKQQCIVTAQGRSNRRLATGFVLQNCIISGAQDYLPVKASIKTYLGRPWHEYSRTLFMQSQLDDIIAPEGWMPWNGNFALDTLWYAEFNNRGPGAVQTNRVKWRGIQKITAAQAQQFTAGAFLLGGQWIPSSGVPYTAGL